MSNRIIISQSNELLKRITVSEWFGYCMTNLFHSLGETTRFKYRQVFNTYIQSQLGETLLCLLNEDAIQLFYNSLGENGKQLSRQTIHLIAKVLYVTLSYAVQLGICRYNPCDLAYIQRRKHHNKPILPANLVQDILQKKSPHLYENLFPFLLISALRYGEAAGLSWDDVDFDKRTVYIHQQLVSYYDGQHVVYAIKPSTKNHSTRTVRLPNLAFSYLQDEMHKQEISCLFAGNTWSNPYHLVFTDNHGGFIRHYKAARRFSKLLKKYGLTELSIHSLRHTGSSFCYAATHNVRFVSLYTGHSSNLYVFDYIHSLEEINHYELQP